jgi:hypothetical protein
MRTRKGVFVLERCAQAVWYQYLDEPEEIVTGSGTKCKFQGNERHSLERKKKKDNRAHKGILE